MKKIKKNYLSLIENEDKTETSGFLKIYSQYPCFDFVLGILTNLGIRFCNFNKHKGKTRIAEECETVWSTELMD